MVLRRAYTGRNEVRAAQLFLQRELLYDDADRHPGGPRFWRPRLGAEGGGLLRPAAAVGAH